MRYANLLILFISTTASAEDPPNCAVPDFKMRAPFVATSPEAIAPLLNADEKGDPGAGRRLVAEPGPYGHSEMGFRYLARMFGYPEEFRGRERVERWIAEQEVNRPAENRGLRKLWERWVVNAPKRLATPMGPVGQIPADGNPEIFFRDLYEKADHSSCVQLDIAKLRCENYLGGRQIQSTDSVYFGRPGGRGYCAVYAEKKGFEETVTEEYAMGFKDPVRKVKRVWRSGAGANGGSDQGKASGAQ